MSVQQPPKGRVYVRDGRRPLPNVPRAKDGTPIKPPPCVINRWQRTTSASSLLDAQARTGDKPQDPKNQLPIAHYLSASDQEKLDAQYKPNLACRPFSTNTFPVNKYQYFSEMPVGEAKRPADGPPSKMDPNRTTYTASNIHKLEEPVLGKYHFFSEEQIRSSPNFQTITAADGLAKPRRAFGGAGKMTASLAALPRR
eukprot:TRINITY_DN14703_c0_g1_i1.p1 TRINITY_DN14703_c0_g1~~TRINITY_DN14703_c0_g1_i1.p1  ORF type:complete len:198 (+),score=26.76 TRINITY_DN14703_c0_g1_i1:49-642(+)